MDVKTLSLSKVVRGARVADLQTFSFSKISRLQGFKIFKHYHLIDLWVASVAEAAKLQI